MSFVKTAPNSALYMHLYNSSDFLYAMTSLSTWKVVTFQLGISEDRKYVCVRRPFTSKYIHELRISLSKLYFIEKHTSFLAVLELCSAKSSSMSCNSNPMFVLPPRSLHSLPVAAACNRAAIFCVFLSCSWRSCLSSCSCFTNCCHPLRQRDSRRRR